MKLKMLSIRDAKLNEFTRPFPMHTLGQAERGFSDEVNNRDSELNKHPEDYELFCVGEFDTETGTLIPNERPQQVALATNLKNRRSLAGTAQE